MYGRDETYEKGGDIEKQEKLRRKDPLDSGKMGRKQKTGSGENGNWQM